MFELSANDRDPTGRVGFLRVRPLGDEAEVETRPCVRVYAAVVMSLASQSCLSPAQCSNV